VGRYWHRTQGGPCAIKASAQERRST